MVSDPAAGSFVLDVAAWLVTYALHSTVLLLAALGAFALIGRAARRSPRVADAGPAWRERIGKVALLAGIATASVQTALGIEPFGLRPALLESPAGEITVANREAAPSAPPTAARRAPERAPTAAPVATTMARVNWPAVPLYLVPVVAMLQEAVETGPTAAGSPTRAPSISSPAATATQSLGAERDGRAGWIAGFVALWALVAGTALVRRILGWRALSLSLAGAEPVTDSDALATFDDLCRRAGLPRTGPRAARLRVAPLLASPVTCGILRAQICVPSRALRDLDEDEFGALLGHEIAHAARHDPAWLVIFRAVEVLLCVQPLNRVVARRIEDDAELLCDDRAVVWTGDRLPLASCLTEVASWLVPPDRGPRLAAGMAAHGARLTRRVERLVDEGHRPDTGTRRPLLTAAALVLAGSAVAVVPGFAAQRSTKPLPLDLRLELALAGSNPHPQDSSAEPLAVENEAAAATEPDLDASSAPLDGAEVSALAAAASAAPETGAARAADPLASVPLADEAPFAAVLDDLEREICVLRADLRERAGGDGLDADLDALARRIDGLRARESAVAALLANPAYILLSPDETGRSAEDQ
ncbi:MAG: M56 family metallopeptidase [Planctomycetota bacterium]|nr:M56 family metallopeptidase [Planctomycetota bacterium]